MTTATIRLLLPVARGATDVDEIGVQIFRKWEWWVFIVMSVLFVVAVATLIIAMFM